MTTAPQSSAAELEAGKERLREVWKTPTGWRYWTSVNNTHVGLWYAAASFIFMLFAGGLALLMRMQLAVPDNNFLSARTFNQAFTLHGTVMMFLFAVPIFEAVAIFLLPPMLGARELPFPRLSAFGFWSFVIGGIFVCGSIFFDAAPAAGWFMYPPLATDNELSGVGADIWLLGLSFIEVASIAAAVELIVGIMKNRAPGMRINLMPLFAWYLLIVAGMILFAFPPLIAGDILFEMERMFNWPFFDATRGGDPILWQHLFWIFGHPEVYIIFLPAIALIAMIVPTFAQRTIVGYSWIVLAAVGTGFLSFGLWVHHMFATGLPTISLAFFSAASEAVAIPTAVQIFVFIATLLAGRVIFSVPMLFATGGLAIFTIGGLTGVMVALAPFDWQAHDTYFVVAHLHYVLIGGMLFPVTAGIYYYFPLVNSKKLSDSLGKIAFWLMFVGFNVAFFPMHVSGLRGMPRRVFTYPEGIGWDWLNLVSSVGAFVFAAGVSVVVVDVLRPKGREPKVPPNFWNAGTLEWISEPHENWGVRSVPIIKSRYPIWDQENIIRDIDKGRFYLPVAAEGRRETLVTTVLDAEPIQCMRVAGTSLLPIIAAAALGGVFVALTFHWWIAALASGCGFLGAILCWLWTGTAEIPEKPEKDVGLGLTLPLYKSGQHSVGWWAMFITMVGDGTAFASLVFGYFFFWTIHEDFPPDETAGPGVFWPTAACAFFLAAWVVMLLARQWNITGWTVAMRLAVAISFVLVLSGSAAGLWGPWTFGMNPTAHAYPATVWILAIWTVAHAFVAAIMQLYCLARSLAGQLTPKYDADLRNAVLYWHFLTVTAIVTFCVIGLFPLAA